MLYPPRPGRPPVQATSTTGEVKRHQLRRSISWKSWGFVLVRKRSQMSPLLSLKQAAAAAAAAERQALESASPLLPPKEVVGSDQDVHDLSFSDVSFPDTEDEQIGAHRKTGNRGEMYNPPSRPLTVAIPDSYHHAQVSASYRPRRPNLAELLANSAPPPWTLSAFMAYLSANHCLETLEFVMDSHRYRRHFEKVLVRSGGMFVPGSEDTLFMRNLWHKLMHAYILPNGSREVNLPSEVRHELISQDESVLPPEPDCLNMAVDKVLELMEESLLLPFLNSVSTQSHTAESSTPSSVEDLTQTNPMSASFDDRGGNMLRSRTRKRTTMRRRRSPNNNSGEDVSTSLPASAVQSPLHSPHSHRQSAPSAITQFARSISQSARHGFVHSHSHSSPSPSRPVSTVTPLPEHPAMPPTPTFLSPGGGGLTVSPSTLAEHQDSVALASQSQHTIRSKQSREIMEPRHSASVSSSKDTVSTARSSVIAVAVAVPPPPQTHVLATRGPGNSTELVTPPTTPPMGDIMQSMHSGGVTGKGGSVNPWKRMRYSFGWRRKDHPSQSPP